MSLSEEGMVREGAALAALEEERRRKRTVQIERLAQMVRGLAARVLALERLEFGSPKIKETSLGGLVILLTNNTGGASVEGRTVEADPTLDDAVDYSDVDAIDCIGVFFESGVADGDEAWIVVGGIANVAFDDNHGPTHGDWVECSEAGYANSQASPAAPPDHFREIGHCLETVAAGGGGTHVLARCNLHFL